MKPLLTKTNRPFLIYVLVVFSISIPVYYFVVDAIWKAELDEHNKIIADQTAFSLNNQKLSAEVLKESVALWNKIKPSTDIQLIKKGDNLQDSIYTIDKQKQYTKTLNIDRFRCLSTVVYINNKPYRFTVETNIEESQETIVVISLVTFFFFVIIVVGLLLLTRKLSQTVWQPFRDTLSKLEDFKLNNEKGLAFTTTDTLEFAALNAALTTLINQNISAYKAQKEFTENASHELQTPLAIIKGKLDVLLQTEGLTNQQYQLVEDINAALLRSSRINSSLLLLAKIENNQFNYSEQLNVTLLLSECITALELHVAQKEVTLSTQLNSVLVKANKVLTEQLINNLLVNAIRHTPQNGAINVLLTANKLEIKNDGVAGLDEQLLFKRFSKLSGYQKGVGLGLAIVNEICKFQGWSITYQFKSGKHVFEVKF